MGRGLVKEIKVKRGSVQVSRLLRAMVAKWNVDLYARWELRFILEVNLRLLLEEMNLGTKERKERNPGREGKFPRGIPYLIDI